MCRTSPPAGAVFATAVVAAGAAVVAAVAAVALLASEATDNDVATAAPPSSTRRLKSRLSMSNSPPWYGRCAAGTRGTGETVAARHLFIHTRDKVRAIPVIPLGEPPKGV